MRHDSAPRVAECVAFSLAKCWRPGAVPVDRWIIGRNAVTLGVGDSTETFDQRYGIDDQSTLTDDESGKVLATRSTAGKAKLQVVLAGE